MALQKLALGKKERERGDLLPIGKGTLATIFSKLRELLEEPPCFMREGEAGSDDEVGPADSKDADKLRAKRSASAWQRNAQWFSVAQQAVDTIFALHSKPQEFFHGVVCELAVRTGVVAHPSVQQGPYLGCAESLSRLLFVVGHVALKMVMLLEDRQVVFERHHGSGLAFYFSVCQAQLRAQRNLALGSRDAKASTDKAVDKKHGKDDEDEAIDRHDSHASEDYQLDLLKAQAEEELVNPPTPDLDSTSSDKKTKGKKGAKAGALSKRVNLLAVFGPVLVKLLLSPGVYNHSGLQSNAALALCKFMSVSRLFCVKHLQLLFTLLQRAKVPSPLSPLRWRHRPHPPPPSSS